MPKYTGGEILVKCLLKEKVKFVFGIPGDQLNPFTDAIYRIGSKEGMQFIMTRHEQAAAHMADAYSRVTGEPGVCTGTVGPGAADLVPGVYVAYADSIPLIVITAQNQTWKSYPDHGSTQALNQKKLFEAITKWNVVVKRVERIPELVERGFRVALSGKPGPVHLDFPVDIFFEEVEIDEDEFLRPSQYRAVEPPAGDLKLVKEAAEMLIKAKLPLIHVGRGLLASNASKELIQLAEYISAPVTTTVAAKGAIPEDHPLCLISDGFGALAAQNDSDAVLLVGSKLGDLDFWGKPPGWSDPSEQKFIQIDISPEMIGLNRRVDLAIVGDAKKVLDSLLNEIKKRSPKIERDLSEYKEAQRNWLKEFREKAKSNRKPIHPLRLIKEVRGFFPRDAISCIDGGNTAVWAHYLNRIYEPRSFLWAADSGHLGTGLPFAIGAKLAKPEKQVYLITGDGAFMFNIQELETAVRLKTNIVVIVANDSAWGMIKGSQMLQFNKRYIGVDFSDVRYDKVAQAMNCYGERVEDPEEIKPALERAVSSNKPAVLDVKIDRETNLNPPDLVTLAAIWLEGCEHPKREVTKEKLEKTVV